MERGEDSELDPTLPQARELHQSTFGTQERPSFSEPMPLTRMIPVGINSGQQIELSPSVYTQSELPGLTWIPNANKEPAPSQCPCSADGPPRR